MVYPGSAKLKYLFKECSIITDRKPMRQPQKGEIAQF